MSRATQNDDGTYNIQNVVGANEFAPNVDDNAFTNGFAITALQFAALTVQEIGKTPDPRWNDVASKIAILKFPDGTTKEHKTNNGELIKQADVNLLTYPLDIITDKETVLKDLKYYEPKLAEEGPAMGQSVFAVIYARLGNAKEAYRLFKEAMNLINDPFWSLSRSGNH